MNFNSFFWLSGMKFGKSIKKLTFISNGTLSSSSYKVVAIWSGEGAWKVPKWFSIYFFLFRWKQPWKIYKETDFHKQRHAIFIKLESGSGEGAWKVAKWVSLIVFFWLTGKKFGESIKELTFIRKGTLSSSSYKVVASWSGEGAWKVFNEFHLFFC